MQRKTKAKIAHVNACAALCLVGLCAILYGLTANGWYIAFCAVNLIVALGSTAAADKLSEDA